MKVYEKNGSVFLDGVTNFNIEQTFTCGQCFRFHKYDTNCYEGVAHNKYLQISQIDDIVVIHNCNIDEFHTIWKIFFDLDCDYGHIASELSVDETMEKAIKFGNGIRILRQQTFECLLSFIISQNNSIYNIERVVDRIAAKYGDFIGEYNGRDRFAFPTPMQLSKATVEEFAELKCGYRAEYLYEFVKKVNDGSFDMDAPFNMETQDARNLLMGCKGIGGKVADCVLLFCYHKFDVFPTDVWVKKAMKSLYNTDVKDIDKFSYDYFGKNRGLAQQYLFFYKRSNG